MKYDLAKMLKEIKEDEGVFKQKKNYWVSQSDIKELIKKMKEKGNKE